MSRGQAEWRAVRGAVGLVASLWLLLQWLTPLAVIGHVANAQPEIRCSRYASSDTAPAERDDSAFCCAAACTTCLCRHLAISSAPERCRGRPSVSIRWVGTEARATASPRSSYCHARAPPAHS